MQHVMQPKKTFCLFEDGALQAQNNFRKHQYIPPRYILNPIKLPSNIFNVHYGEEQFICVSLTQISTSHSTMTMNLKS